MTPEEVVERAAEVLERHRIGAFNGTQTACDACNLWMTNAEYRRHLVEKLAAAGLLPTEVEQRHRCDNVTDWVGDARCWLSKDCEGGNPETQRRYVTSWQEVIS